MVNSQTAKELVKVLTCGHSCDYRVHASHPTPLKKAMLCHVPTLALLRMESLDGS